MCLKANIYSQSRRRELQKTNCFEQIVIEKTRAEVKRQTVQVGDWSPARDITRRQAEVGKRKKKKKIQKVIFKKNNVLFRNNLTLYSHSFLHFVIELWYFICD